MFNPASDGWSASLLDRELMAAYTALATGAPLDLPPLPGATLFEPNDLEFYLLGRLQGRTGHSEFRSTTNSDDPLNLVRRLKLESRAIQGPHGFSD